MAKIKRLFNDPYDIVEEMVEGYVGAHKQYAANWKYTAFVPVKTSF